MLAAARAPGVEGGHSGGDGDLLRVRILLENATLIDALRLVSNIID